MTRILAALSLIVFSFSMTACGSSTSPVSPTSVASTPAAANDGPPTSVGQDLAAAAKPGDLTIVGLVTQDDGEFDFDPAASTRDQRPWKTCATS
jgi:hypothetical protein